MRKSYSYRNWANYSSVSFYVGDFDTPNAINNKGWGLLSPYMQAGTLDGQLVNGKDSGTFNFNIDTNFTTAANNRPVTQVPDEAWSENDVYGCILTLDRSPQSSYEYPQNVSDFESRVQLKSPWFYLLNRKHLYRIRGVFGLFPFLSHTDQTNNSKRNWAKIASVDGIDYMSLKQSTSTSVALPMSVYVQLTGSW